MLTKTNVYDFIDKVERKALDTVKSKYKADLDKAIELELNKPQNKELLAAIITLQNLIAEGVKAELVIKRNIPRYYKDFNIVDLKNNLFGHYGWNFPDGFDEIRSVHVEYEEKLRRTKEEYAKIKTIVKNKKTGEHGKTALIALGFDVSYLDKLSTLPVVINKQELKANKELLFPCDEYGITG